MTLLQSILLGLIQGLTEFLPVSSSGHLAIFKGLFHINTNTGILFDVLLHLGTLIAIFAVYYKDIWEMIKEGVSIIADAFFNLKTWVLNFFSEEKGTYRPMVDNSYRKFVILVLVSTIPTGIMGLLASDFIEQAAATILVPGCCLLITSVLLFISDRVKTGEKLPKNTTYGNALFIGICQGFATLPGLSRSGTTITACLLCGFDRKYAVKYSFIMSIPAVLGAAVLELKDFSPASLAAGQLVNYAIGMAVAAVVGYICIKTMLVIVRQKKFTVFAIYCLLVGCVAVVAGLMGIA